MLDSLSLYEFHGQAATRHFGAPTSESYCYHESELCNSYATLSSSTFLVLRMPAKWHRSGLLLTPTLFSDGQRLHT